MNREIKAPDNPLSRMMDAVTQPVDYGSSQGVEAAPSPPPRMGPATVVPPPPTPVPQEPEPPEQWISHPVGNTAPPSPPPQEPQFQLKPELEGFIGIEMVNGNVVGDNGEVFPLTDQERTDLISLCFAAVYRSRVQETQALAKKLGVTVKEKKPDAASDKKMPGVSAEKTDTSVQPDKPKRKRGRPPKKKATE